jgi:hypothetical protein
MLICDLCYKNLAYGMFCVVIGRNISQKMVLFLVH